MQRLYVLVTLGVVIIVGKAAVPPVNPVLHKVLNTVEKGLNFFAEDYSAINVDGLFGLRLGQGQLREAIRECNERSCDYNVLKKIETLEKKLDTAADAALPYVASADPAYYERFLATINKPYITPYEPTEFSEDRETVGHLSNYDEEKGDGCYARMLGTFKEKGNTLLRCNITHDCWDYMTQDDTSNYFITHQLLYFIMIDHMDCRDTVEKFVGGKSVRDVQKRFCNKIYREAQQLSQTGNVSPQSKDLFLEQTVLCGPLGFEDFMRPDWMEMVLRWPDERLGCFKMHWSVDEVLQLPESTEGPSRGRPGSKGSNKEHMRSAETDRSETMTMRKLQREKQMKDGCLSHTSGLGFGVLCTYLRYLIRYSPMYMM